MIELGEAYFALFQATFGIIDQWLQLAELAKLFGLTENRSNEWPKIMGFHCDD